MKKIIYFVLLFPYLLFANIFEPFPKGLSIQMTACYPSLSWDVNLYDTENGDREVLWIKPNFKINYEIHPINRYYMNTFIGYGTLGGKSKTKPNGYKDKITINSLEIGIINSIKYFDIKIGVGFKWNKYLDIIQEHYGYLYTDDESREWIKNDLSWFFRTSSYDWGIRASRLLIGNINVSIEYWSSIFDIESKDKSKDLNIRSKLVCLGIGYNF